MVHTFQEMAFKELQIVRLPAPGHQTKFSQLGMCTFMAVDWQNFTKRFMLFPQAKIQHRKARIWIWQFRPKNPKT